MALRNNSKPPYQQRNVIHWVHPFRGHRRCRRQGIRYSGDNNLCRETTDNHLRQGQKEAKKERTLRDRGSVSLWRSFVGYPSAIYHGLR